MADVEQEVGELKGQVSVLRWLVVVLVLALVGNMVLLTWTKGSLIAAAEAAAEATSKKEVGNLRKDIEVGQNASATRAKGFEKRHADAATDREKIRGDIKDVGAQTRQGQQQIYSLIIMAVSGRAPVPAAAPGAAMSADTSIGGPSAVGGGVGGALGDNSAVAAGFMADSENPAMSEATAAMPEGPLEAPVLP
jgi:hypothetical protein